MLLDITEKFLVGTRTPAAKLEMFYTVHVYCILDFLYYIMYIHTMSTEARLIVRRRIFLIVHTKLVSCQLVSAD